MGDDGSGSLISPDGVNRVMAGCMVSVSASVIFPYTVSPKEDFFGTGSPRYFPEKRP